MSSTHSMTLGSFDLIHPGHLKLLRVTNRLSGGKPAIVGVNSDRWMREFKHAPTQTEKVRMEMMRGLGLYATVLLNDGPGRKLIKKHKPTYLVIGSDWFGRYHEQIQCSPADLEQWGVTIIWVDRPDGSPSTSALARRAPPTADQPGRIVGSRPARNRRSAMTSWVVTPAPRSRLAELRTMLTALDHPAQQCAVISVGPHPIRCRDIDDLAAHLIHVPNPLPLFGAWLNAGFHYIAQIDQAAEVLCIGSSLSPRAGLVERMAVTMRQQWLGDGLTGFPWAWHARTQRATQHA